MTPNNAELDNSQELQSTQETFTLFIEVLDTMHDAFEGHHREADAAILGLAGKALEEIRKEKITEVEVRRRVVRDTDRVRLDWGEHPGVTMVFTFADGKMGYINAHGGIGREVTRVDMADTDVVGRTSHTLRTESLVEKPSQLNVQVKDLGGEELYSVWMTLKRNDNLTVTSAKFTPPNSQSQISISGNLSLNNYPGLKDEQLSTDQSIERYSLSQMTSKIEKVLRSLVSLTPPPPIE